VADAMATVTRKTLSP